MPHGSIPAQPGFGLDTIEDNFRRMISAVENLVGEKGESMEFYLFRLAGIAEIHIPGRGNDLTDLIRSLLGNFGNRTSADLLIAQCDRAVGGDLNMAVRCTTFRDCTVSPL